MDLGESLPNWWGLKDIEDTNWCWFPAYYYIALWTNMTHFSFPSFLVMLSQMVTYLICDWWMDIQKVLREQSLDSDKDVVKSEV